MSQNGKPRRGVLLLVVLSVLVLFVLAGLAFIIVAGQYRRGAVETARHELVGTSPRELLDGAMYQLVRDTRNAQSSIQYHSLLADLYGNDGFAGRVLSWRSDPSGQYVIVDFQATSGFAELLSLGFPRRERDYFSSSVFTLVTAPASGSSTRIVSSSPIDLVDGRGQLILEGFESGSIIDPRRFEDAGFRVNGRPFNGSGFGYDPSTRNLDLKFGLRRGMQPVRVALLPSLSRSHPAIASRGALGGADESWEAVDFQNMFLAMVPPTASRSSEIIPSFHRPHLVNYWRSRVIREFGGAPDSAQMRTVLAASVARPNFLEHPNFTGSNPAFARAADAAMKLQVLVEGPWDVDNDGDGVPDSVWIDAGFPDATAVDGRRYRPLVAILCTDLDGRVNLNAHGHQRPTSTSIPTYGVVAGLSASDAIDVPRGSGYGPPEIDLSQIFGNDAARLIVGRYGPDGLPGIAGVDDPLSLIKTIQVPRFRSLDEYSTSVNIFGAPPDFFGQNIVVLDHTGHPLLAPYVANWNQTLDDPYEINLVDPSPADSLYTVAELERLLRGDDVDAASLPNRLANIAPAFQATAAGAREIRRMVTTHSFDIPVPNFQISTQTLPYGNISLPPSTYLTELVASQLRASGNRELLDPQTLDRQLRLMIPHEILHGQRMDVNRPYGNGRDDNGNLVVDEGGESASDAPFGANQTVPLWVANSPARATGIRTYEYTQWLPIETARQTYARNLYCLMMMLIDQGFRNYTTEELTDEDRWELTSRRIAQWAINAADFRDADAIMTPFEYDANPRNGWQEDIDGDPRTVEGEDRRLVWGCEYPEFIMTETLALHDRRVKDTDHDDGDGEKRKTEDGQQGDDDLDQYRIPQGSLFIELYCTRARYANNPVFPRELYAVDHGTKTAALHLGRMSPPRPNGVAHPVWRIAIGAPHFPGVSTSPDRRAVSTPDTASFEPANMSLRRGVYEPTPIERTVWFTNRPGDVRNVEGHGTVYYNQGPVDGYIQPARYAVVGPRRTTTIGWNRNTNAESRQQFVLTDRGLEYRDVLGDTNDPAGIQRAASIVAAAHPPADWENQNRRIGLSVSEPLPERNYYREPNSGNDGRVPADAYDDPLLPAGTFPDQPLDSEPTRPLGKDQLLATMTLENYCTAFLQRLANPLLPWNPSPVTPLGTPDPLHDSNLPVNPYITVDWIPINLSVYNGEDAKPAGWDNQDPVAMDYDPHDRDPERFRPLSSLQRSTRDGDVWAPHTTNARRLTPIDGSGDNFPYNFVNSLGYLNTGLGRPLDGMPVPGYNGDPPQPFPWLTWNNRPFVSHLELMLVPASSPSRLLLEFGQRWWPEDYRFRHDLSQRQLMHDFRSPYAHLMNFFYSSAEPDTAPHYFRIFDFLEVPSRFVGTETWYDLALYEDAGGISFRRPPHRVSRFRDPGRININTIYDEGLWRGLMGDRVNEGRAESWRDVQLSRRGYPGDLMSSIYPTQFTNPFRSAGSADLMPFVAGMRSVVTVNATLLRRRFGPFYGSSSSEPYQGKHPKPSFTFQGYLRMANLVTTHSNVFAVWITVGFFEVDVDSGRLGQELDLDTGKARRHRAFYVIDRSIPVAFEPGKNHNVDRAIVLRRFIE